MKLKSLYNPIAGFVEQISGATKLKRGAIKVVLSFLLTIIFIACNEQNHNLQLGEIEQSFDEQLVSISQENDSVSWIGSAEGDVWRTQSNILIFQTTAFTKWLYSPCPITTHFVGLEFATKDSKNGSYCKANYIISVVILSPLKA